jgi:uncharacterized membrane protein
MTIEEKAIQYFIQENVLTFGDFTLKSGRKSPYFFNTGKLCSASQLAALGALSMTFVLSLLLALALAVPVYMAIWFAPALIMFHDVKPLDAMKLSFFACLKNIVPFLLYGIILMVLCVVASIPFGLGFLVLGPVIVGSIYAGYRDIFTAA